MKNTSPPNPTEISWHPFRWLVRVFLPYWRLAALLVGAMLTNAALGLVAPLLTAQIIDRALPRNDLSLLTTLILAIPSLRRP